MSEGRGRDKNGTNNARSKKEHAYIYIQAGEDSLLNLCLYEGYTWYYCFIHAVLTVVLWVKFWMYVNRVEHQSYQGYKSTYNDDIL